MLPNDKFIFPDATVIKPSPSLQTRIGAAPSCNGKTFCEQVSDYPSSFVRDAIKNDRSLQNYANVDSVGILVCKILGKNISHLNLNFILEQIVYPKTAQNANKQWLYVLNVANFTQGVRIETCMQEDQGCNIIGGFAEGYVTTCKQKYIHRQLAAIVDGAVSHELFRFPASCCCHVQFVGTSTRMRIGKTSNAQDKPDDINAN
ncbi:Protein spaetzle [Habropoda laboriosa]|uniref:Protein spaetzle n=1 Tax=Habropoda laboriosa TaxID=597456 RepID=A0A0L7QUM3_9HYME|nr:Protein spaetzle [Habropoda laboriosa]